MTMRRRIKVSRTPATRAGVVLTGLLALGVAWYAGAALALGLGADADVVDSVTGYRVVVAWLADLPVPDGRTRAVVGVAGVVAFVVLGRLALAQLPRPRVPRATLVLDQQPRGATTVSPRAIERAVEGAVAALDGLEDATARWEGETITVLVSGSKPRLLVPALSGVDGAARDALARHGLPAAEVQVVLRRVRPASTREVT